MQTEGNLMKNHMSLRGSETTVAIAKSSSFTNLAIITGTACPRNDRRRAFTLAEVLITLAIIGIVAALTIPTLISNFQKRSYVSALQKSYATLQNGFKLMLATEGVDYLEQTKFFKEADADWIDDKDPIIDSINNNLSKYFKIVDAGQVGETGNLSEMEYYWVDGSDGFGTYAGDHYFQLQNGTIVYVNGVGTTNYGMCGRIAKVGLSIDVNGVTGPNTYGRDLFHIEIGDINIGNNKVFQVLPYGQFSHICSYGENKTYSKRFYRDCDDGAEEGYDCMDRIIEDGWKMNY